MKTVKLDFYYLYLNDVKHIDLSVPDDTVFSKVSWTAFTTKLERYKNTPDTGTDEIDNEHRCSDYYMFVPFHNKPADIKLIKNQIEKNADLSLKASILVIDNGIIVRFANADLPDYSADDLLSLEGLNKVVDLSSQYYKVSKTRDFGSEQEDAINKIMKNDLPDDERQKLFDFIKQSTHKIINYFKIVRIDDSGIYIKNVGVNNYSGDLSDNSITHYIANITDISPDEHAIGDSRKITYKGIKFKDTFEKRIQEIVNI